MPIYKGNKKLDRLYHGDKEVARRYRGDKLVYENKPWYSEYGVPADYVISNGFDNWVDTFIGTQQDLIIEMGLTYLESGREQSAFGAYDLNKVVVEAGSVTSGGNAFYAYDDDRTWDVRAFDVEYNKHYNLKYNFQNGLQIVYIDDVEVHRTTNTAGPLVGLSMVLFARNYGTSSSAARQNYMKAKWTHFKLSKSDGTVLADYKPFYISKKPMVDWKNRTHEVGVYTMIDMVRRKAVPLYGEPLEGSYTPWWKKYGSSTPYVITNGTNNYIDTGVMTQTDLNIDLDVEYLKVDGTSEHLFGGVNGTGFNRRVIELGFINGGKLTYAYGYSWTNTDYVPQQDTPYKISAEFINGSQTMYVNGVEEYATSNTTAFDNVPISMYLFTRNEFGTPASNMATVKLKGCKVSKPSGEVLLDYTPIYLDSMEMTDANGRVYPVGSFVLVDNITENVTKLYGDALDGIKQELSWFETTPSSTGIRTNFVPTGATAPLTKIELMCNFTSGSSGYLVNGIGGGPTMYIGMNPSSKLAYGNLGTDSSNSYTLNYDTYYKLTIDYKNKTISVNDEVVASNISLFSYSKNNINFGLNCYVNTVSGDIFNNWGQKTQYCKIYVDDVLTHHWVGKINNDKVDIYDKVEEVYLGNLGLIEGAENIIAGE